MNETLVRVVAEYQMMADSDHRAILNRFLVAAPKILGYEITGHYPGAFGIHLFTFSADLLVPTGVDNDEATRIAKAVLDEAVGDTDVDVRWVTPFHSSA